MQFGSGFFTLSHFTLAVISVHFCQANSFFELGPVQKFLCTGVFTVCVLTQMLQKLFVHTSFAV